MNPSREGTFDSEDDSLTSPVGTPSRQTVKVVVSPYAPLFGLGAGTSFEQGSRKTTSSRMAMLSGKGRVVSGKDGNDLLFEPEAGDSFIFEGKTWVASIVKKTGPDGEGIMYEVGVSIP